MLLKDNVDIEDILDFFASLIRVGVVVDVYPQRGSVRVEFKDQDNLVSHELKVLHRKTHKDKDLWMVDVGEEVLCIFLPNAVEVGFVLGAIYSQQDKVPTDSQDKKFIKFEDGTVLEYDRKKHLMRCNIKGDCLITASSIRINAKSGISINGDLDVDGNIHATGTIIDEQGNTNHHSH